MPQHLNLSAHSQWRQLGDTFESLAKEERAQGGPLVRATVASTSRPLADVDSWRLDGATSHKIREHFALIGTQAGHALGTPPGRAESLDFWLHCLRQNVCERASGQQSVLLSSETNSSINVGNVCEESMLFCLSLQRQALAHEADCRTPAECFSTWIEGNSSAKEPIYWSSPSSVQIWLSLVAKGAKIPIHFLSARLNVHRLPLRPSKCDSLRTFFDQIATEHELIWCITRSGLWWREICQPKGTSIPVEYRTKSKHYIRTK